MLKLHVAAAPAPGRLEEVAKMHGLTSIYHVEHGIGPPALHAITNGSQIGRGVRKSAISLLHQGGRLLIVEENDEGALTLGGNSALSKARHDVGKHWLIKAFTKR